MRILRGDEEGGRGGGVRQAFDDLQGEHRKRNEFNVRGRSGDSVYYPTSTEPLTYLRMPYSEDMDPIRWSTKRRRLVGQSCNSATSGPTYLLLRI